MLYLIVNNDFHVTNLFNQYENLKQFEICVIRIPYSLENDCRCLSDNVMTIKTPYRDFRDFINPFKFYDAKRKVDAIPFTSKDVIIFLTEYDPINQYVAYSAKKAGAKSLLLEEGIAAYYKNKPLEKNTYSIKDRMKIFYIKFMLGCTFIEYNKQGEMLFLQLKDQYIDIALFYREVQFYRNIKHICVNSSSETFSGLNSNSCVFLNQPLYQSYLSVDEYKLAVDKVLKKISGQFETVYFKYHPREDKGIKAYVTKLIKMYPNIDIIPDDYNISESINNYKPLHAISFFSDALFKLSESGLNAIFMYPFFPKLNENPVLKSLSRVLSELGYEGPSSTSSLRCNTNFSPKYKSITLATLLRELDHEK